MHHVYSIVIGAEKRALGAGVEDGKGLMGEGTVSYQHGTGVEGSSHHCREVYHPK
jgi:hypothetical protein